RSDNLGVTATTDPPSRNARIFGRVRRLEATIATRGHFTLCECCRSFGRGRWCRWLDQTQTRFAELTIVELTGGACLFDEPSPPFMPAVLAGDLPFPWPPGRPLPAGPPPAPPPPAHHPARPP